MKFTVHAEVAFDAFSNVAPHAAADDYLPTLSAVHVTVADDAVTIVATDRYTLGVAEFPTDPGATEGSVLLPIAAVKDVVKLAKAAKGGALTMTVEGDRVTVDAPGESRTFLATVGEFPKWRSLWPADDAHAAHETIGLGPSNVAKFAKLQRGGRHDKSATLKLTFGETPTKPVVVTVSTIDNFRALVMPVRLADAEK